jgi:predicted Holliday junction resolvase-like endonuclease
MCGKFCCKSLLFTPATDFKLIVWSEIMNFSRIYQIVFMMIFLCAFSLLAKAADISTLQTALALAQDNMDQAKNKRESTAQAIVHQQRVVEEQKKQLAEANKRLEKMQLENKQASEQYLEAKQKFENAQATLKQAWDSNNK